MEGGFHQMENMSSPPVGTRLRGYGMYKQVMKFDSLVVTQKVLTMQYFPLMAEIF